MHEHRKILLAVRAALYGAAVATTPALLATAVGVAHGRVAEPITRCEQAGERAVCDQHGITDELDLHVHEDEFAPPPPEPQAITPRTGNVSLGWWHNTDDDETHRIVQENLRRQRNLIAAFVRVAPAAEASK